MLFSWKHQCIVESYTDIRVWYMIFSESSVTYFREELMDIYG